LGVWIYGDGQGEVLNFQLRGAPHISHGIGDHYVIVDFTGWRYFELIEPEGERHSLYSWGYGDAYSIYRESVNYSYIDSISLWYNNVPKGGTVINYLSPVKALPLMTQKLGNPSITVGNKTIKFPAELESGSYIEFHSMSDCRLYGGNGELIGNITPVGEVPIIEKNNNIRFGCESANTRAKVTIIGKGDAIQ